MCVGVSVTVADRWAIRSSTHSIPHAYLHPLLIGHSQINDKFTFEGMDGVPITKTDTPVFQVVTQTSSAQHALGAVVFVVFVVFVTVAHCVWRLLAVPRCP